MITDTSNIVGLLSAYTAKTTR